MPCHPALIFDVQDWHLKKRVFYFHPEFGNTTLKIKPPLSELTQSIIALVFQKLKRNVANKKSESALEMFLEPVLFDSNKLSPS